MFTPSYRRRQPHCAASPRLGALAALIVSLVAIAGGLASPAGAQVPGDGSSAPTTSGPTTEAPAEAITGEETPATTDTTAMPEEEPEIPEPTTATTASVGGDPVPARPGATLPEERPEALSGVLSQDQWRDMRSSFAARLPCGTDPGLVCDWVYDRTGNELVAESLGWLVDVPLLILVILVVAVVVNRLVRRAINRHLTRLINRSKEEAVADPANVQRGVLRMATASSILGSTATVVIFAIAGLIALSEIGIDLGPMLAGAGIAGIAIGFGAQNLVRDVLAGLFVIIEDQYGVGDIIDAGNASGVVEEFSLRVTKIRDVEGTLWFVPNGVISEVGNKTQLWSRAILDIEIGYGADHHKAGELIKETADRLWHEERPGARIIEEPELWGIERLGESGVAIRLAVKSAPADQFKVARLLRAEIKDALDAAGIEIPFPQRTIWLRSDGDRSPQVPRP